MNGKNKCQKCEHEWFGRLEEKPKMCPRCKTYDWEEKNDK